MTTLCDQCQQPLFPCDLLGNLSTCVECARRALRASRTGTRAVVVSRAEVAPSDEWQVFAAAVRRAVRDDGTVHQTEVRPLIASIPAKHRGLMYRRARSEGLLVEAGWEQSTSRPKWRQAAAFLQVGSSGMNNQSTENDDTPTALIDREGNLWRSFSGIWYRREASGGYGECRGTRTMLERDFGPMTLPPGASR